MQIRIGGVPEHFNYLWQWQYTQEVFRKHGYYLQFTEYKGGTGAMIEALQNNQIDFALMLTEGALASIANNNPFKIWFPFVISPLIWGIFTTAKLAQQPLPAYNQARFAVSRLYSGSHLMSQFLASQHGMHIPTHHFLITKDLEGAIHSLSTHQAHYFLWEKYMTMHLVQKGIFQYHGNITAPWPAFVFVAQNKLSIIEKPLLQQIVLECISNFVNWDKTQAIPEISEYFGLRNQDTTDWFNEVKFYDGNNYWQHRLVAAQLIMKQSNMLQHIQSLSDILQS